jgi:hypothetical protein
MINLKKQYEFELKESMFIYLLCGQDFLLALDDSFEDFDGVRTLHLDAEVLLPSLHDQLDRVRRRGRRRNNDLARRPKTLNITSYKT